MRKTNRCVREVFAFATAVTGLRFGRRGFPSSLTGNAVAKPSDKSDESDQSDVTHSSGELSLTSYRYFRSSGASSLTVFAGQSFLSVMMASFKA